MYSLTVGAQRWLLGGLLSLNQCSVSIHPCAAKPVYFSAPPHIHRAQLQMWARCLHAAPRTL